MIFERKKSEKEQKLEALSQEIKEISERIFDIESCFNEVSDDELCEALIFERIAYQKRLDRLIREAKNV